MHDAHEKLFAFHRKLNPFPVTPENEETFQFDWVRIGFVLYLNHFWRSI